MTRPPASAAAGDWSPALSKGGYPWISGSGHAATTTPHHRQTAQDPHPRPRTLRIGRWGNVLAVRLPQALSDLLRLQMGDELELQLLSSGQVLLTPAIRRSRLALDAALQRSGDQP